MTLPSASPASKTLVLGTALWGWGVGRATAHQILDRYVALGGRIVDTAANYPINKRPEDFAMAANWIADWVDANGVEVLSILVKIGATDNMGESATLFHTAVGGVFSWPFRHRAVSSRRALGQSGRW
jgi:aryl-alcohol dehydrogenase-like predicted oxidoreductase